MTCTFRNVIRGLATTFVVFLAGAPLAAGGPITTLETVELADSSVQFSYGPSERNLDSFATTPLFQALGSGRSGEGIAELDRIDFGRGNAVPAGTLGGTDVVPVPEPASLLLLTTGLGALAFARRRTTPV
jgi:hypothetical protein